MPIYEFQCAKCGRQSEVLVRSTKWEGTHCPHCGSTKLEKKLSVFSSGHGTEHAEPKNCSLGGGTCNCCCAGGGEHSC